MLKRKRNFGKIRTEMLIFNIVHPWPIFIQSELLRKLRSCSPLQFPTFFMLVWEFSEAFSRLEWKLLFVSEMTCQRRCVRFQLSWLSSSGSPGRQLAIDDRARKGWGSGKSQDSCPLQLLLLPGGVWYWAWVGCLREALKVLQMPKDCLSPSACLPHLCLWSGSFFVSQKVTRRRNGWRL